MTPEQFAYWLQGFTELSPEMEQPTVAQWKAIKEHLQTVFVKVTPPVLRDSQPAKVGPATTQEDRPGKALEDALRILGRNPGLPNYPGYPGLGPVVTC